MALVGEPIRNYCIYTNPDERSHHDNFIRNGQEIALVGEPSRNYCIYTNPDKRRLKLVTSDSDE